MSARSLVCLLLFATAAPSAYASDPFDYVDGNGSATAPTHPFGWGITERDVWEANNVHAQQHAQAESDARNAAWADFNFNWDLATMFYGSSFWAIGIPELEEWSVVNGNTTTYHARVTVYVDWE